MVFFDVDRWFADRGDQTLRLDYDLNENSVVLDLGGYHGAFAQSIYNKFKCKVYVFEPYIPFYNMIASRFSTNLKVKVFDYGISDKTGDVNFVFSNDGSTIQDLEKYTDDKERPVNVVKVKSFKDVYEELNLDMIDLLKVNVEGAEYGILNNIFDSGYTEKIVNYQVQFHPEPPGSEKMLEDIREHWSKTHKQDWNYQWVWENWSLK